MPQDASEPGPERGAASTSLQDPDRARSLGPLASLQDHVPPDWWRTLFGPLYLLTDADVVMDPALTEAEVDRVIDLLDLHPEDRILDLCCGQGRHALELARRGFEHVQGLDRSAYLVQRARRTASAEHVRAAFEVGDCRELPYPGGSFDAVLVMGNSFGYFDQPGDDRLVLREVRRVLKPAGRALLDVTSGAYMRERFEPRSWEWLDEEHLACRERELAADGQRLVSREIVTHVERGVLADQFYAERLYEAPQLCRLMKKAGFAEAAEAEAFETASARGQDLGMMAHRIIIIGRAGEHAAKQSASNGHVLNGRAEGRRHMHRRHVVVLLGDPRLPDETKAGGRFDADDFEVVGRMKAALATLGGYRFTYLDDHAALADDLRRLSGEADLVFNLCDEGLRNDPRKELHVPALLEMLGLPYTGTCPQGLAHCYDKSLVRGVAREVGVPVATARVLLPGARLPDAGALRFPVLVKPNAGDNSRGITQKSVARDAGALAAAVAHVRQAVGARQTLLIEEFLPGKDLTVGVLGNAGGHADAFEVLPITEDDYSALPKSLPRLCGFEAKWLPESPYWQDVRTVRAELPEATCAALRAHSLRMFERLGLCDYARFDWRLDADGRPRLLEANPNPGWCWDGHLAKQAALAGTDYAALLGRILKIAEQRLQKTPAAAR